MKALLAAVSVLALGLALPSAALAVPLCPAFPFAANTDCNLTITVGTGGIVTIATGASPGTYDGAEDVEIGITNNSGAVLNSINLNSGSSGLAIFGFDGDGIDTYCNVAPCSNASDNSGYGGPLAFFTGVNATDTSGTVNFLGGLANGGFTYFSLEEAPTATQLASGPTVPEPSTLLMMGTGIAGFAGLLRRKFAR